MARLREYRRKRRPDATSEPFGGETAAEEDAASTLEGAFVVQVHDATRRHFDLRLEVGGALASFAIPRGPSLDPSDKVLAIKTEDHPLEYLEFEEVIPEAQYGAGPMIVWDRGKVEYLEGPAEDEIDEGKLHFRLRGMKLRGAFALVKLNKSERDDPSGNKADEWLLFKKDDEHADPEREIARELPRSVLSGLTVEELERKDAIARALEAKAFELGGKPASELGDVALVHAPSSARGASSLGAKSGWVYDAELEGVRVRASRDGDVVSIVTDDGGEAVEAFYPEVVRALRALPARRVSLDGTLVAFDASGHPRLARLAERAARFASGETHRAATDVPAVLVAQDLLALGGADVRALELSSRRELLGRLLPELGFVRAAPPLEGALDAILAFCASHEIAGVVTKKKSSVYDPRKAGWLFFASGSSQRSRGRVDHRAADAERALRRVVVTNRGKVFWPPDELRATGYTKGDLCDYYAAIAPAALPYLRDRPVILVRYPDGIAGKSFYQWNVPAGMPAWVRTLTFTEEDGETKRGFLVDDASTLAYIANLGCIPLHILGSRVPHLDRADFATLDFDVKQSELRHAVTLARALREMLDAIGLPGLPKTSGQSGLHVLVPLGPGQGWPAARALADLLGKLLVERFPELATMERSVSKRGAKVYVDTGQTGKTRAIVAPYSARAVPGATVSTPLSWDEVDRGLDPRGFTIATVPARVAERGDLFSGLLTARPDVAAAVSRLSELVARRA